MCAFEASARCSEWGICVAVVVLWVSLRPEGAAQTLAASLELPFPTALVQVVAGGVGQPDRLLAIGDDGRVRISQFGADRYSKFEGDFTLPDPAYSMVAISDLFGRGDPQLIVVDSRGTYVHEFGSLTLDSANAPPLLRRARNTLRLSVPTLVDVVQDANGDGRLDLVIPGVKRCQIWIQQAPNEAGGNPAFVRTAEIGIQSDVDVTSRGSALSDVLESIVTIPRLEFRDLNGDGRPDLLTAEDRRRHFHIQRPDGRIPETPDVSVDLALFRDTTPRAAVEPGRTLAGGDDALMQSRDLNGDGIPDYVIAHRRKIWVFHGTKQGPQFTEPTTILVAADDVTLLLLPRLDGDAFPDLLALRVQVPTTAELVLGMLGEFTVDVSASGYRSKMGQGFETRPDRRGQILFRLPSLARILRDPGAIISRFEGVGRAFRKVTRGDVDGDALSDVLLLSKDETFVDVWLGNTPMTTSIVDGDALLRKLFFEDPDRSWDLDRMIAWLESYADDQATRATGGRPADRRIALRAKETRTAVELSAADVDGDGRDELVATYRLPGPGRSIRIDILGIDP